MDISFLSLGYFIAIFICMPRIFQWIFHCNFHMDTQALSLQLFIEHLGDFIVIFHCAKNSQKMRKEKEKKLEWYIGCQILLSGSSVYI